MNELRKRAVSDGDKRLARHTASSLGGRFPTYDQFHDTLDLAIGIMEAEDRPTPGLLTLATIGLWATPMRWGHEDFPTRLELLGAFPIHYREDARQILAAAAFSIMRTRRLCFPGSVMPGFVGEFIPTTTVPHLYFTSPGIWAEGSFRQYADDQITVNWLHAIPISDAEYEFLKTHDKDVFETMLEAQNVDVCDVERASVT